MSQPCIVAELRRAGAVSADEIKKAVVAYLADPACAPFRLGNGHLIDVPAIVREHRPAAAALADPQLRRRHRRVLVHSAIALARTIPPATPIAAAA